MNPSRVDFVLVRPSLPANVAAACRALKNMGFGAPRVVEPAAEVGRDDRAIAYGAWDLLDEMSRHRSLEGAVAGASFVVSTSGRDEEAWTPRDMAQLAESRAGSGRLAVVFGPEATGLSRLELLQCHERVRIPTAPAQPSLNLAQAVLILAYELRLERVPESPPPPAPDRAEAGQVEEALRGMREALQTMGYLNPQNPDAILGELRAMLFRAGPTRREARLLRGLARQLGWAARRLRSSR
jgi:TrmH family RNA methyltransferase